MVVLELTKGYRNQESGPTYQNQESVQIRCRIALQEVHPSQPPAAAVSTFRCENFPTTSRQTVRGILAHPKTHASKCTRAQLFQRLPGNCMRWTFREEGLLAAGPYQAPSSCDSICAPAVRQPFRLTGIRTDATSKTKPQGPQTQGTNRPGAPATPRFARRNISKADREDPIMGARTLTRGWAQDSGVAAGAWAGCGTSRGIGRVAAACKASCGT